ncbi:MAG: AlbA family DNA-binding domain-containing protein [Candidatus Dormibacteria bacterium]
MVVFRSRRLESVFGAPLDALTSEHVKSLVTSNVQEAFDLDFKRPLYGRGDSDKRALAGDVAALANTAGGIIVLGVEEDEHARAVGTPGVALSDAEVARMRQIVASLAAPMPDFDVLTVPDSISAQGEPAVAGGNHPPPTASRHRCIQELPRSARRPHQRRAALPQTQWLYDSLPVQNRGRHGVPRSVRGTTVATSGIFRCPGNAESTDCSVASVGHGESMGRSGGASQTNSLNCLNDRWAVGQ